MRVTLAALALVVATLVGCGGSKQAASPPPPVSRFDGLELQKPTQAPPLALHDQDGRLVRLAALRGKTVFVTFLYTHCPDVCPLIATNLDSVVRQLGSAGRSVRILAVSVDPKGDTPAAARHFVRSHGLGPQFHFLLGSRAELAPIWKAYHVAQGPGPESTVNHSAYTLLVDHSGRERLIYDAQVRPRQVLHDLRLLG